MCLSFLSDLVVPRSSTTTNCPTSPQPIELHNCISFGRVLIQFTHFSSIFRPQLHLFLLIVAIHFSRIHPPVKNKTNPFISSHKKDTINKIGTQKGPSYLFFSRKIRQTFLRSDLVKCIFFMTRYKYLLASLLWIQIQCNI